MSSFPREAAPRAVRVRVRARVGFGPDGDVPSRQTVMIDRERRGVLGSIASVGGWLARSSASAVGSEGGRRVWFVRLCGGGRARASGAGRGRERRRRGSAQEIVRRNKFSSPTEVSKRAGLIAGSFLIAGPGGWRAAASRRFFGWRASVEIGIGTGAPRASRASPRFFRRAVGV